MPQLGIGRGLRQRRAVARVATAASLRSGRLRAARRRHGGVDVARVPAGGDDRRGARSARRRIARRALAAEHLVELPAGRQIERHVGAGEPRAVGTARRLVDRDQAGQPRHQMMLEREREDALVGLLRRDRAQRARDLGVGDLAPRPQLGQALAFGRVGERQRDDPRLVADQALDLERAGERADLGRERHRLAAIEVGQHGRRHVGAAGREGRGRDW